MPATATTVSLATDAASIRRCYPVMLELRIRLTSEAEFLQRVQRQQQQGYLLAYLEAGGEVRTVAGYRYQENLVYGSFMYVDDLVTRAADHGQGYGAAMMVWLEQQARAAHCQQLVLDSGVQRFGAHRFYLTRGMDISAHHFTKVLTPPA